MLQTARDEESLLWCLKNVRAMNRSTGWLVALGGVVIRARAIRHAQAEHIWPWEAPSVLITRHVLSGRSAAGGRRDAWVVGAPWLKRLWVIWVIVTSAKEACQTWGQTKGWYDLPDDGYLHEGRWTLKREVALQKRAAERAR